MTVKHRISDHSATKRGQFIVLEGPEGSGKSTNLPFIAKRLEQRSIPLLVTREPGGTEIAEQIRNILLQPSEEQLQPLAELLLIFAGRLQHLQTKIMPALEQGIWVLCDRFTDASYAYQGAGRELDVQRIQRLEQWVQGDLRPDLVILLDVPVTTSLQRISARQQCDRFEQEQQDFYHRVRQQYLARARSHPERYWVIDADRPLADVQEDLRQRLQEYVVL